MEKGHLTRALLAAALSMLILLGWEAFFSPRRAPQPDSRNAPASAPATTPEQPGPESPAPAEPAAPSERIEAGSAEDVVLESDLARVVLSNRGAQVKSWKLKEYRDDRGEHLDLVPCFREDAGVRPLAIDLETAAVAADLNSALWRVERKAANADGRTGSTVEFTYSDGAGIEARKTLTLWDGTYLGDLNLDVRDRGRRLDARAVWGPSFQARGSGAGGTVTSYYNFAGQALWNLGGQVTRLAGRKVEDQAIRGPLLWAGLEDQYFTALTLPRLATGDVRLWNLSLTACPATEGQPDEDELEPARQAVVAVSVPPAGAELFVGPKQYRMLQEQGRQLDKAVWFSSYGLFEFFAKGLFVGLDWLHRHVVSNWGVAIILATVLLRLALFPLNQFSMVRMKRTQIEMSKLQPKVNAIKKKYAKKKDAESRQKMNQEIMELYRAEGVNPAGGIVGCLPLLAQFPILIGFYNMLTVAIELRGAPFFGWIQDLSLHDRYWILPILMGATMFVQQRMSMTKVTDPVQRQQQQIMMIMPFFFTYLCVQMPAGMVLYWFVNNLLGIGQQWLVNRHTEKLEARAA